MSSRGKSCSTCNYWQSYPLIVQFGTCGNPESGYYGRGVSISNEACECFALNESVKRRCERCHGWYPVDTMPYVGVCQNSVSPRYGKVVLWDRISGACFEERSLERVEFAWCRLCRETVPVAELQMHRSHDLYAGTSRARMEDIVPVISASG